MIIVMEPQASEASISAVDSRLQALGFKTILNRGTLMTVVAAIGDRRLISPEQLAAMPGVEKVVPIQAAYKLASRQTQPEDTVIRFANGVALGGASPLCVMAGPCSVEEDVATLLEVAQGVKAAGATFLRGGAFKPRTSPYDFQGLGEAGLQRLAQAREATGLLIVTEVVDAQDVELVADYADMLQVGARNMQNYKLLNALGSQNKPVLLKRGLAATIKEFLLAAEYILAQGNPNVALCERGIRGNDASFTRNILDLAAVPVLKHHSHLPVVVDPSHGTGKRYLVPPMAKAAVVSGADGLMMEVHTCPDQAWSDGEQTLTVEAFTQLMTELAPLSALMAQQRQQAAAAKTAAAV